MSKQIAQFSGKTPINILTQRVKIGLQSIDSASAPRKND
jgi:hypothetical protein